MEDVLHLYAEPYNPAEPLVCFDEKSMSLHAHVRDPILPAPGHPARYDAEYERLGTANLFVFVEPLAGKRCVEMTAQRTKKDFAHAIRWLVDEIYPDADIIRVVMDNLNTHDPASLYDTFPPEEAFRICQRLDIHYTPKHGSWLNMAEIEIGILDRACLSHRVASEDVMWSNLCTVVAERNHQQRCIHWRFTCDDAREHLKHLYPVPKI